MPLFSAFTPFGMLDFSSEPSEGEKIYDSMIAGYIDPRDGRPSIDVEQDGTNYQEAGLYASAMAIAACRLTLRRAGLQLRPETSYDQLEAHEHRYSIAPGPNDTVAQRRAVLAARQKVVRGPRLETMLAGLSAILGSNFIAYRPVHRSEITVWPEDPGEDGPGIFVRNDVPAKAIRILDAMARPGFFHASFAQEVAYENLNAYDAEVRVVAGDVLCVDPGNLGLADRVEVISASGTGTDRRFTARFFKAHSAGAPATTGPIPIWNSTKRHAFVVVKAAAAVDAELRRRVDEFMVRTMRACATWAIVEPTTPSATTIGPFTLGSSPLGVTPIEELDIVPTDPPFFGNWPTNGPAAGGTVVRIYGSGIAGTVDVLVDGGSVAFTQLNDHELQFTTPAHAAGFVDIEITSPNGTWARLGAFNYT